MRVFKPFKPPLRRVVPPEENVERIEATPSPPAKRRRISGDDVESLATPKLLLAPSTSRKPLDAVNNLSVASTSDSASISNTASESPESYWLVLWRKFTTKKNKTWDGDGVLSVRDSYARLQDVSGKEMGRCAWKEPLLVGSILSIAGKEVEVDEAISKHYFTSGKLFLNNAPKRTPSLEDKSGSMDLDPMVKRPSMDFKKPLSAAQKRVQLSAMTPKNFYNPVGQSQGVQSHKFKTPLIASTMVPKPVPGVPTPLHNPDAPGALVMKRLKEREIPKGKHIVDVVLDPHLTARIRPHQREGVQFLYECVMGMRSFNGNGAMLTDEMGLGKTFQTIALLWTLLKQNPIAGAGPVIKKALVVCPVGLCQNWRKEFHRWLGKDKIGVMIADDKTRLTDFTHGRSYSVMIIGYEKLRSVQDELVKGADIDIIVVDEGHRLKTAQNKSGQAIKSLNTPRRILLTGTPLQNNLSEFYVTVDFVNPGLLSTYNTFKKEFEGPIVKGRLPKASKKDKEKGEARMEELLTLTKDFMLRRTAEVQAMYLPPKTEYVLFCKPTSAQVEIYQHILGCPVLNKVLGSSEASLQLITILKKVCNSPALLSRSSVKAIPSNTNLSDLVASIPSHLSQINYATSSSKFRVLEKFLTALSGHSTEKIVLVSNYTSTLDLMGQLLSSLSLTFLRLDGSTPTNKRQDLVDTFNRQDSSKSFAFLLSAKSGGTGINLIGASRLILFDVDWNPATDLQAMARVHRPGQKRPVKIYRFLMAGGMDEKIYQRQITKMDLANSVVDGKKSDASFSPEELRDLFTLKLEAVCQTHDLLGCECKGIPEDTEIKVATPEVIAIDSDSDIEKNAADSDDEDEDDLPLNPAMLLKVVPASQYDWRAIEQNIAEEIRTKREESVKGKMQALMAYAHIDTSIFAGTTTDIFGYELDDVARMKRMLDDEILLRVLEEAHCKVGYIFARRAKMME